MYKIYKKIIGPKRPVNIEHVLKALANRRRLSILKLLEKKEVTVGKIAQKIKLSFRSTSRHLAILSSAGLLEKKQAGVEIYYSLATNLNFSLKALVNIILQDYI